MRHAILLPVALLASAGIARQAPPTFQPTAAQTALQAKAHAAGATALAATAAPGGSEVKAISSVVPRVTLPHAARLTATSAAARDCLNMMYCPPTASADGGAIV